MLLHQVVVGQGPTHKQPPAPPKQEQEGTGKGARAGLEARFYRALYDKLKAPEVRLVGFVYESRCLLG